VNKFLKCKKFTGKIYRVFTYYFYCNRCFTNFYWWWWWWYRAFRVQNSRPPKLLRYSGFDRYHGKTPDSIFNFLHILCSHNRALWQSCKISQILTKKPTISLRLLMLNV